ncbi:Uncharacterised protein [Bordetella pertussis]|nr:Uncharacterised protein [Bordetella pertussis]
MGGQFGDAGLRGNPRRGAADPAHFQHAHVAVAHIVAHDGVGLQGDVDATVLEQVLQPPGRFGGQLDLQLRVRLRQAADEWREPGMDDGFDHAQAHAAAQGSAAAQGLAHGVVGIEHALGVVEQGAPGRRQPRVAAAPLEQQFAQVVLERGNAPRDRGLGQVQLARGGLEAAQLGDPDKGFEKADIHGVPRARVAAAGLRG